MIDRIGCPEHISINTMLYGPYGIPMQLAPTSLLSQGVCPLNEVVSPPTGSAKMAWCQNGSPSGLQLLVRPHPYLF